uniref:Uncharacterized protein n=1 Tax=Neobacillus citreus TaxID=2833578 RepID=A0A942SXU5_9BACI
MNTTSPARRRGAMVLAIAGVALASWAPIAVAADLPLALAAGTGGIALVTAAGSVDRRSRVAPLAFLGVVAVGALALVLHWTLR